MRRPARTSEYAVEATALTKRFPKQPLRLRRGGEPWRGTAVDHVDLQIRPQEIFGLVGANGAGKTTLIKMLTTLLVPTSGQASVGGLDVVADEHEVREVAGLVTSNERSFYWRLTGRQNLAFFARLYNVPPRDVHRRIDELLDLLGLAEYGDQRFDRYSTGLRQRLAIARGLLSSPKFLFMDEPTKGVDPLARARLEQVIRDAVIGRWSPTILITSHNLNEIERLCERVALMSQGRIISVGTVDELRRIAHATERFELAVRNVGEDELRTMATMCAAVGPIELAQRDGATDMVVDFAHNSDGFTRLVRGIVESGGDLLTCTRIEMSFDDVFQRLVEADERAVSEVEAAELAMAQEARE